MKLAPQLGHLRFLKAKQQMNPKGNKTMAKKMPRKVNESSRTPTLRRQSGHAGQGPRGPEATPRCPHPLQQPSPRPGHLQGRAPLVEGTPGAAAEKSAQNRQQRPVPVDTYMAKNTRPKSLYSIFSHRWKVLDLFFHSLEENSKNSDSLDSVGFLLVGGGGSRFQ